MDETRRYKPAREELNAAGYQVHLSTGPLLPRIGKFKHSGIAAVYEQTTEGVRQINHGIDGVHGRTKEETIRKMKEAILNWIGSRENEKRPSHRG